MGFALADHTRRYLLSEWADRLSALAQTAPDVVWPLDEIARK